MFGNAQVSQLGGLIILGEENIGRFYVPMDDLAIVQRLQSLQNLDNIPPNNTLLEIHLLLVALLQFGLEVSSSDVLHHNVHELGVLR